MYGQARTIQDLLLFPIKIKTAHCNGARLPAELDLPNTLPVVESPSWLHELRRGALGARRLRKTLARFCNPAGSESRPETRLPPSKLPAMSKRLSDLKGFEEYALQSRSMLAAYMH